MTMINHHEPFILLTEKNPAPPGMYKTPKIMGYLPYQLVQDSFPSIIFAGILVYNMSNETRDFVDILAFFLL